MKLFVKLLLFVGLLSATANQVTATDDTSDIVKVHTSTERELVISIQTESLKLDTVKIAGKSFLKVSGGEVDFAAFDEDAPSIWEVKLPITVPAPNAFRLESVSVGRVHIIGLPPLPIPAHLKSENDIPMPEYRYKSSGYAAYKPQTWASLEYSGVSRGVHKAMLRIIVAQGTKKASSVEIPEEITVHISFSPTKRTAPASTYDVALHGVLLNGEVTPRFALPALSSGMSLASNTAMPFVAGQGAARIHVEEEGIYRLTAQQVAAAGLPIDAASVARYRLYGSGGKELNETVSAAPSNEHKEQPIIVRTNPDGSLESILFYAAAPHGFHFVNGQFRHYINHFTRTNTYLLTLADGQGLRAEAKAAPTAPPTITPNTYIERFFHEEDVVMPNSPGSGRRWLGRGVERNFPASFTKTLDNLDVSGEIFYRVSAGHRTRTGSATMVYSDNGNQVALVSLMDSGSSYEDMVASESSGRIAASRLGGLTSRLQVEYRNTNNIGSPSGNLDWHEIHYPRSFVPLNNEISFFSDTHSGVVEYSINGFTPGSTIRGFDVTDPARPMLLTNLSTTGGLFRFVEEVNAASPKRFFVSADIKSPVRVESTMLANIRSISSETKMLIVTHQDLLVSAREYAAYRQGFSGLQTEVVTIQSIYDEFNGGLPDPTAIRDFVAYTYFKTNRELKYLLMWGNAHFDFRNISTRETNFVPTYQSFDTRFDGASATYATDEYFTCVEGDDNDVDLSCGRFSVRSNAEGAVILDKVRRYEAITDNSRWRSRHLLVADDSPTSPGRDGILGRDGTMHTRPSDSLFTRHIPHSFLKRIIYLPDYPLATVPGGRRKPRAAQDLIEEINRGHSLVNWIGHGNPRLWAHEEIFDKDITIIQLRNRDRLFYLTAATCDFSRYDDPNRQSGAEDLISHPDGGAIAVFSASRIVFASSNEAMLFRYFRQVYRRDEQGRYLTLGELLFRIKQYSIPPVIGGAALLNNMKYILLGDPAMRVVFPEQQATITSINGVDTESLEDRAAVSGLSTVQIEGNILDLQGQTRDMTFNGNIQVSLHDAFLRKVVTDDDGTIHNYSEMGGLLGVGTGTVENGKFSVQFVVPRNISFSDEDALIHVLASSENSTVMANTGFTNITVSGIGDTETNDTLGPDIYIYFDDRSFRPGDLVAETPLLILDLEDESGINASGSGVGQHIEAWIDENPFSLQLTQFFAVDPGNFRRGSIERLLSRMEPGIHSIRVRAWDVFNNMSEVNSFFRVGEAGVVEIGTITVFPNPSTDVVNFTFRHTAPVGSTVSAKIYSVNGTLLSDMGTFSAERVVSFSWSGMDRNNIPVAAGVYLCAVELRRSDGASTTITAKFMISR